MKNFKQFSKKAISRDEEKAITAGNACTGMCQYWNWCCEVKRNEYLDWNYCVPCWQRRPC